MVNTNTGVLKKFLLDLGSRLNLEWYVMEMNPTCCNDMRQDWRGAVNEHGWMYQAKKILPVPGRMKNALDIPFHRTVYSSIGNFHDKSTTKS